MQTIAFKVKPNTDLYNNYFRQKTEKEIFGKLAEAFMNEHFPNAQVFALADRLTVGLSEEEAKEYANSLIQRILDSWYL